MSPSPRTPAVTRAGLRPRGEGSQTGEVNTGGKTSRFPQNVNTAAPETQRVTWFKTQLQEENEHGITGR